MIKEHDCVVLMQDLTGASLKAGDAGTIVHVHQGGAGYEVEFMTLAGENHYGGHAFALTNPGYLPARRCPRARTAERLTCSLANKSGL